ncbi:hypothetical protein [Bowmanella yangjiangensis]|uniref:Response regulatory domain-containing protein n=1 Tax=Bowmanella yangjiangensis TaxID=2811230 RepID=A0ABS3CZH3_9ALTE|nr:hypothetical protein [Bowmanella yangjiangensis]MBN7822514.1 hypothetical protein [Bowmanella yangjiangensis]
MDFNLDVMEKWVSLGAGIIAIVGALFFWKKKGGPVKPEGEALGEVINSQSVSNVVNLHLSSGENNSGPSGSQEALSSFDIPALKKNVRILFIDDDRGFKIVGILKKMGWEHTKIVVDVSSLEQSQLVDANVVFVDIQGVGKMMHYADEGLGLALAIKRRYPEKKVIIYSAQEEGERFHEALQEADYNLPKTAEPIRFEDTIVRVMKKNA